jgi:hypothetical protein
VNGIERTRLERAIELGVLTPARATSPVFATDARRTGHALLNSLDGRCVFHDDNAQGGCRIHRALGHAALPLACRQFPRQSVRDPRGVSVTLSHYCPTASDLLVTATGPTRIVEDAPAFPADAEYVGLTADSGLPPLLHPRLAMDWESWWLFEDLSVSLLSESPEPLDRLGLAVEFARGWTVGNGALADHIRDAFNRARAAAASGFELSPSRIDERIADVMSAVPEEWRDVASDALSVSSVGRGFTPRHTRGALSLSKGNRACSDAVSRRYLAAHAFANWAAYQGEGLRTWFRAIETAASLLRHTADPGRADLVLRHLADSTALVRRWNQAEKVNWLGYGHALRHSAPMKG